jgi:glycosyltransferase involved in cell wall biosynthesis
MDCDLQDPPELLVEMLAKWRTGYDVVYAQRRIRFGATVVKRTVAKVGYAMINRFADVPIPKDTGNFRLLDRRVVDELARFNETHGFPARARRPRRLRTGGRRVRAPSADARPAPGCGAVSVHTTASRNES